MLLLLQSIPTYYSCYQGPGPVFCNGLCPASESDVHHTSELLLITSEAILFSIILLSHHINHISGFFSTQIITFPGFIPSKTTISAFIQQERSPKPAENSIFHICQKITYFDILSYFCHFPRFPKITHFHKNTKITYFHYFSIRWRFCDFHLFSPFPQNTQKSPKWENWPKWGFPGK